MIRELESGLVLFLLTVVLGACGRSHPATRSDPPMVRPVAGHEGDELPGSARALWSPPEKSDPSDAGPTNHSVALPVDAGRTRTDTQQAIDGSGLGLPQDGGGVMMLDAKPIERLPSQYQ
jgi:hypothetical protein